MKIFRFALGICLLTLLSDAYSRLPNILFILVDDLGYMDIGANNPDTFYETPSIDGLAAEGMRFTDGYAANPVCSPTRYSLMTGKYPTRIQATNYFPGKREGLFKPAPLADHVPLEEITLAEVLRDAGYRTFFAGKWHLGEEEAFWPEHQGFDINRGGWSKGGPWFGGKYFSPYGNPRLEDGPEGEFLTARLADETIAFMEANRDEPFLAYLSFYSVHTPLMAPEELVRKYEEKAKRSGLGGKPQFGVEEQVWPRSGLANPKRVDRKARYYKGQQERRVRILQSHAVYAAMVESMDTSVGRVLAALDDLGIREETIVCFTSDNGGLSTSEGHPTSNLPLRGGKGWIYEGGIREPFIVRWPGVTKAGSVNETPVCSIDFFPTLLEAAGVRRQYAVDGVSLIPELSGEGEIERDALFWHYPHYSNQGGFPSGAVRVGDWKLIERYEDGRTHLYHLKDDIGETTDLAESETARVTEMRRRLHDWYEEVDALFLRPKDPWTPERN
ncbi:MAG: sulfatase [Verrucomicrobiota bacterium]